MISAEFTVRRGQRFELDIGLRAADGETVALLGPNGAGKTTALRALAGLLPVSAGSIDLDGEQLDGPDIHTPPERRPSGVVFQDYLLFPHMSVLENVAFGLRARGIERTAARSHAHEWLRRMDMAGYARVKPRALSGGQAQRVALARALATEPRLLLLDEPLAALDASTRIAVRSELRRHLGEYSGTCVVVSHDPLDAMVLADRLLVLEDGRVVQQGSPSEIAESPRTEYVASLVGLNLYRGTAAAGTVELASGGRLTVSDVTDGEVFVAFPPNTVGLYRECPRGTPRNTWPVVIDSLEQHGGTTRVHASGEPDVLADVTPAAVAALRLAPGDRLWAGLKATEIRGYPA